MNVSWLDANSYCQWLTEKLALKKADQCRAGGAITDRVEWEKAARSSDERIFPWGNEWSCDIANTIELGVSYPLPVGSVRGASPFGVLDMAGQVGSGHNIFSLPNTIYYLGDIIESEKAVPFSIKGYMPQPL